MDFQSIGAFEAKTHLSRLLQAVEHGKAFLIRRRGRPVAKLIPAAERLQKTDIAALKASFQEMRRRISGKLKVRDLIREGRRF